MTNTSVGGHSVGYSDSLLISAIGTVGVSLLVVVMCFGGFCVYKKSCSNLHQVVQGNNIDGLLSSLLDIVYVVYDLSVSSYRRTSLSLGSKTFISKHDMCMYIAFCNM